MLKFFIQSPDVGGKIDPPVFNILMQIPGRGYSMEEADIVLVPITRFDNFQVDVVALDKIGDKPWVLVCFCEYNWDWDQQQTHIWGDTDNCPMVRDHWPVEYLKFDDFVHVHPPLMTFKRELLKKDVSPTLQPVDYLTTHPIPVPQTRSEFLSRPFDWMFYWGRSSEHRMKLHGDTFIKAGLYEYDVISQFDHMAPWLKDRGVQSGVVSVHAPHYARADMNWVLELQAQCKISVAMPGAGVKTFRDVEASLNAVVALPHTKVARAFPWTEENSVVLGANSPVGDLVERASLPRLYDVYRAGVENCCKYSAPVYFQEHVIPAIERNL